MKINFEEIRKQNWDEGEKGLYEIIKNYEQNDLAALAVNYFHDLCTKRIESEILKAENTRLAEQLENSVQLPCKVGGVIYWVTIANDFECSEFYYIDEGIVKWVMVEEDGTYRIYVKYNSGLTYQHHIEKTTQEDNLYQSLSEAEARLKELEEQHDNN